QEAPTARAQRARSPAESRAPSSRPAMEGLTCEGPLKWIPPISVIAKTFSDDSAAWLQMEEMRWPDGPVCPHCGSVNRAYFLNPENGQRRTSTGKVSHRRLWKCAECRKKFSVLVGTIFEGTHVPLSKWLMALFLMASSKNGVAAFELHRTLGITNETAWFMTQRIREAMKRGDVVEKMTGTIVSDETYIGGKPRNRHQQGRTRPGTSKGFAGHQKDKAAVLSLVNKTTGEVRSRVVPTVTSATLAAVVTEQVNIAGSRLHTDAAHYYRQLGRQFASHQWVDHSHYEYVRGDVSTNQAEGFFSQLKRSLDGTHHHVSKVHLHRYLAEFDFRYSTRKMNDTVRMHRLVSQAAGRRLSYSATR
ncbi:MAG: IS1595 family transposase, partial [Actinobacteria bacterium]|nr:IS1595 family transposase [Actinomycetota bacterium]